MDVMIVGYSAAQVRAAEAPLLAAGVPLMQRAAAGLAREVRALLGRDDARVLVLAGSGDNGADALYAAGHLATAGMTVTIVRTGERIRADALEAALGAGAREVAASEVGEAGASADLVIDGILGTGTSASPALRGPAREIVAALLEGSPRVVAVDIPSGIGPDDGSVPDPCVLRAEVTVTFGGYKAGLLVGPAVAYAGEVRLIDIGLAAELAKVEPIARQGG